MVDSLGKVYVPILLSERPQIENQKQKHLGSYTSSTFIEALQYITKLYSLTFRTYMILTKNLLPEECRLDRAHANEIHQTNTAHPARTEASGPGSPMGLQHPRVYSS